ncbi:MAG: tetratricopeptide repeat protein [Rhodospirillaceae bacterium]|jgi:adenylate cyclase|nr:tetratricopeptide repeat protein [Rhodospirillaceae bacterium]MBT5894338.1 tetratricopeptide repeat protein [Rhodospirillaceae bacterium]
MTVPTRKLAAILAADVVGYSRLMGEDQAGTLDALRQLRKELFEPVVEEFRGNVVKRMGDGWIVEFASVSDAVDCAIRFQLGLADHEIIRLRAGIHIGEVVLEDEDVFGEGVNVAARLEELAEPGEVLISDTVHNSLDEKSAQQFGGGDIEELKNIARSVQVWRWSSSGTQHVVEAESEALPLPDKPSIAVLPFDNMSGDPEQEYFADGITEDIITALSRFRWFFVIARNSSFAYKGQAVDIKQVGRDLGVRYVLEGSVRKASNRVRITAQFIEAETGNHLWADRYDGNLDDIFELQDRITESIIGEIEPELGRIVRDQSGSKNPGSLSAWDLYHQGLAQMYMLSRENLERSIELLTEAIALDPEFAPPRTRLSAVLIHQVILGYVEASEELYEVADHQARAAIAIDPNDAFAHMELGRTLSFRGDPEAGLLEVAKAIEMNPNAAYAYFAKGNILQLALNRLDEALVQFDTALRLSPRDPYRWGSLMLKGTSLRGLGRYAEAIECCKAAALVPGCGYLPDVHLAACLAGSGDTEAAAIQMRKVLKMKPDLTIASITQNFLGAHPDYMDGLLADLRKGELPEE